MQKTYSVVLRDLRSDPDRGMFCIDWNDYENPIMIGGEYEDDFYSELDIILAPCNYVHTMGGYTGDSVHPDCNKRLKDQWNYVGPS